MVATQYPSDQLTSDEWLMSKRLATALKLSPEWRGGWLTSPLADGNARFHLVEQVSFRRMLLGGSQKESSTKIFTVSTCGRYLLVRSGHDVFVYRIGNGGETISAVVRLAADCDVLKVSMDTSSGRYAVAALLANRTGLLWDITDEAAASQTEQQSTRAMSVSISTGSHTPGITDEHETMPGLLPQRRRGLSPEKHGPNDYFASRPGTDRLHSRSSSQSMTDVSTHHYLLGEGIPLYESPEPETNDAALDDKLAIQTRPTAIYRGLGTSEDPPRSVAICPQRKCVAFGSRLGIELHWIDALTGGDLNRWFPLAAPSDHLYFLPQRAGVDSSRKLRLISSSQGPSTPTLTRSGSMPARLLVRRSTHDRGRRQSMTRLFFGSLPFPAAAVFPSSWTPADPVDEEERNGVLRTVDCDHYQASPLSDGHHVLYTDPTSGHLCLGSDAPVGAPTKLVRKVIFIPPDAAEDDGWASLMSCYTAGQELRWGVQVVAAHRDGRIILYSVPADLFHYLRHLRSSVDVWDETSGVLAQSDLLMDDVLSPHPNSLAEDDLGEEPVEADTESPFRTIQVEGVQIGHVGREIVDDIAVNTANGGVSVWIFCRSGLARLFDIYVPKDHIFNSRFVSTDGLLYDEPRTRRSDSTGPSQPSTKGKERANSQDIAPWASAEHLPHLGFDGACDIELNVAGGVWITEPQWENKREHDAFPECFECDEEMASLLGATRLGVVLIGSASREETLYAEILAEEWHPDTQGGKGKEGVKQSRCASRGVGAGST